MERKISRLLISWFALLLLAAPACATEIHLASASSLKEVMNELTETFSRGNPGIKFIRNYGASGTLAKQIENDAPADIFISANVEWMAFLKDRKLVESSSIATFAFNTLVFAGATGKKVSDLHDVVQLEKIAIGSPRSVPAGQYALVAIQKAGLEKQLGKKLVMARDVRESMMYAERGEVDGAFVYRSDALRARQVRILFTVPQELYPRVIYPMAMTVTGARNKDAVAFFKYLSSSVAKGVLSRHGFALK